MRVASVIGAGLLAAATAGARALVAQGVGVGTLPATAQVVIAGTITRSADVRFGNVMPGVAKTVAPTDATAGAFMLAYPANARIRLDFALPNLLTAAAGQTMPVGSWNAVYNTTPSPSPASGAATINPKAQSLVRVHPADGTGYVFVGGTVTPASTQSAGVYAATVTLTATLIGF